MKPLLDDIAEAIYNYLGYPPSDGGMTAEYKGAAQAAIDVVERRLLSEDAIKVARVASGLGFGEASDVIGETWQQVKGGERCMNQFRIYVIEPTRK